MILACIGGGGSWDGANMSKDGMGADIGVWVGKLIKMYMLGLMHMWLPSTLMQKAQHQEKVTAKLLMFGGAGELSSVEAFQVMSRGSGISTASDRTLLT